MEQLILASGSPRRKELLEQALLPFKVITSQIEEHIDPSLTPEQIVQSLAMQKASAVAVQYPDAVVLGADTIVTYEKKILGKPADAKEAKEMLSLLSGKSHDVYTGVAILAGKKKSIFYKKTLVTFYELVEEEITRYVSSGEPFDKAGAYGIQGLGATLVKEIVGDYFSVVGLPLARTVRELEGFGIKIQLAKKKIT